MQSKLHTKIFLPPGIALIATNDEGFNKELSENDELYSITCDPQDILYINQHHIVVAYIPEEEIANFSEDFFRRAEVEARIFLFTERIKCPRKAKTSSGMNTERMLKKDQFNLQIILAIVRLMRREFSKK